MPRLYSTGEDKGPAISPAKEKKPAKKETVAKAEEPKTGIIKFYHMKIIVHT